MCQVPVLTPCWFLRLRAGRQAWSLLAARLRREALAAGRVLWRKCWRLKQERNRAELPISLEMLRASVVSDSVRPMDCSPPGSSVHGISQARVLEWVAMLSSRGSSKPRDQNHVSCIVDRFLTTSAIKGEGNGNPLQYSCLGNPMGGVAW